MQTYTSYKPSNIEWIGEIPSHWDIRRVSTLGFFFKGKGIKKDQIKVSGFPCIRYGEIYTEYNRIVFEPKSFIDEVVSKESQPILKGDVLFTGSGETVEDIGKAIVYYGENEVFVGGDIIVLRLFKGLNPLFISYLMNANFVQFQKSLSGRGEIVVHIYSKNIREIITPIPPLQEQQAIVNYLDHKTALIDELIIKKEKKIELLKEQRSALINHVVTKGLNPNAPMKDSGIDWIGEIPEHWERKKIKQISKIISKGTTPSTVGRELLDEGEVRYLKAENISDNKVMLFPSFFIDNETDKILSRSKLLENDILVVIAGATLGKVAILTKEFIPANTNQAVSFIRLKENHNVKYIWYWLSSSILQQQIWIDAVQSAQPNLSMENLGNFCFTFPPLFEQKDIVKFLDNQTTIIDKSIEIETQKIEKLKEYRQSLISNVVTGKICVTA